MVYLLDTTKFEWDQVPVFSHELVEKQIHGIPLQEGDIPADVTVRGTFDLPDICKPTDGFLFVSDRGRIALEEIAPGCIAFFLLNVNAPASMHPARAYYFIDVLPRAHCVDWDKSETLPRIMRAPDGRESRAIKGSIWRPTTIFKPVTSDMPPIWRGADEDFPTVHFFQNKKDVFMRDDVWKAINDRFPGQLLARKLA
jgi:hypothetical protein